MNRSERTVAPSGDTSSTGLSISTGPPGTTTTRRAGGHESASVGTDHHQILVTLTGPDEPVAFQEPDAAAQHRTESDPPASHHPRVQPARAQSRQRLIHSGQFRMDQQQRPG